MLNEKIRTRNGNMSPELQAKVDELIEEFMAIVNAMAEDRHLQKGIARSQLPNSMVAILDKEKLSILAQFRLENRFARHFNNSSIVLTPQQAANSAQWEFGLEDAFIIQFPKELLDQSTERRHSDLRKISSHISIKSSIGLWCCSALCAQGPYLGRRHSQPVPGRSSCSCPRIRIREKTMRPY